MACDGVHLPVGRTRRIFTLPAEQEAPVRPHDAPLEASKAHRGEKHCRDSGASMRLKNQQAGQAAPRAVAERFQKTAAGVTSFGRGGVLCRSPDKTCVDDVAANSLHSL